MYEKLTQPNIQIPRCYPECIAKNAGVDLLPGQVELYEILRKMKREPNSDGKPDHKIWSLCDQQIQYLTLNPDQQLKYEERYSSIDFTEALECFNILFENERQNIEHIHTIDNTPQQELLTA